MTLTKQTLSLFLTLIGIVIVALFAIFIPSHSSEKTADNVVIENNTQIITVRAKNGYLPAETTAKAGIPTILRLQTENTYDCSAAISIPQVNINQVLAATEQKDYYIGKREENSIITGSCSSGSGGFTIKFE